MEKENIINEFIKEFRSEVKEAGLNVTELSDNDIANILNEYFECETLSKADDHFYDTFKEYVKDPYTEIDWNRGDVKETEAYKGWNRYGDIRSKWSNCFYRLKLQEEWVGMNGKAHTDEEAAKIAADKWCELLFNWHLQDNGALNETHGGGFPACALATILANDAKEGITQEMKVKAYSLFYQYYLRMLHYETTRDKNDIEWLKENLKPDDDFDWEYFHFRIDMYCDYGPSTPLYIILLNAGIPAEDISCICPWKTGISIRTIDNTVMYSTYQHRSEL